MEEEAVAAATVIAQVAVAEAVVAEAAVGMGFAGIVEVEEIAVAVAGRELEVRLAGCWKIRPTPARLVRRRRGNRTGNGVHWGLRLRGWRAFHRKRCRRGRCPDCLRVVWGSLRCTRSRLPAGRGWWTVVVEKEWRGCGGRFDRREWHWGGESLD